MYTNVSPDTAFAAQSKIALRMAVLVAPPSVSFTMFAVGHPPRSARFAWKYSASLTHPDSSSAWSFESYLLIPTHTAYLFPPPPDGELPCPSCVTYTT